MADVHPTAIVDPSAEIAGNVEIGAYTIVEAGVRIAASNRIGRHNVLLEGTSLGEGNVIGDHNSLGTKPFDKKYRGERAFLEIGAGNTVHAFCTLSIGTDDGGGVTRIGDGNWIMAYVHVAHDSIVGDGNVIANAVQIAGHVEIGDRATLGGGSLVHQFCRVGSLALVSAGTYITMDLPPFFIAAGGNGRRMSVNRVGMQRAGFTDEEIRAIDGAFSTLYRRDLSLSDALGEIAADSEGSPKLKTLADFLERPGRGIIRPSRGS